MSEELNVNPNQPMTYGEAESIWESQRPESVKKLYTPDADTKRKEDRFNMIAPVFMGQGLGALDITQTEGFDGPDNNKLVTLPLKDWEELFLAVDQAKAGYSTDLKIVINK